MDKQSQFLAKFNIWGSVHVFNQNTERVLKPSSSLKCISLSSVTTLNYSANKIYTHLKLYEYFAAVFSDPIVVCLLVLSRMHLIPQESHFQDHTQQSPSQSPISQNHCSPDLESGSTVAW